MKYSVTTKSSMCSLFSTLREPSVNRKDLQALTLVGPTRKNPELTPTPPPPAVLHLDNRLFICNLMTLNYVAFCEQPVKYRLEINFCMRSENTNKFCLTL